MSQFYLWGQWHCVQIPLDAPGYLRARSIVPWHVSQQSVSPNLISDKLGHVALERIYFQEMGSSSEPSVYGAFIRHRGANL